MKRQSPKLIYYFLFGLLLTTFSFAQKSLGGKYNQPYGTSSLIQTFPPLPPSGRNGSFLGEEVTDLGDLNGDGYDDFAVGLKEGAVYPSGEKLGKVYIYFGSSTLSSEQNPDIILTGENDSDRFGCSVASAGDVNNDGFPDIIVGAYYNSAAALLAGRAYLFFGGPELDNVPDAVFTGEGVMDYFGFSVASAGDINNDGFSDMIVGAYFSNRGAEDAGSAYLYLGGTQPDNIPDLIFVGEAELDNFGYSVASAGDVNNDGFSDIIIGANLADGVVSPDAGGAYIFLGGTAMDNIADITFKGTITSGHFGTSVSSAGDVNNDGFYDVIIGYPISEIFFAGESIIYFGGVTMDNTADVILTGESGFDSFGICVSTAGDVNKDGFSDVIVGATSGGFSIAGSAYLYFGGANMDSIPDVIFEGEAAQDFFGTTVSAAGDVNNDGFADIIAGANWNDGGGIDAGRVYIYFGGAQMNNTADIIFTGEKNYDNFGNSVASAGDVNNDGFSDIIVGAVSNDDRAPNAGSAYLYFGGNEMKVTPDITFTGEEQNDGFGVSVSSAGDLNNDGFSDIVIGSYFNGLGGLGAGSAYIYFGGTNLDNSADLILSGGSFENFGNSVASAGDVNKDGFSDLIIGAYNSDATVGFETGRAYLFFGGNPMDNIPDVIFNGEAVADNFGISVSSAGDLNNDGFSDIIIGAYLNDADGDDAGRAFIYFGGETMDNTADIILEAESRLGRFGTCVSSVGDVNDDGFSDVIVGAQLAGPNAEGRAYLYFGGTGMDNIPDLIFTGESLADRFGTSVSSAGDVNNDGFPDIIIGAYASGANGYNSGKAYIYFGGTSMDNTADAVFTGRASSDFFGISVASAGDVNNDGYSDMFIGASGNCAVGFDMGRAYLYAGGNVIGAINDKNFSTKGYNLFQAYPNPFNPLTHISFELPEQSNVKLIIYDVLGKEITTIENNRLAPGYYERDWKGADASGKQASSGVYFYRLLAIGESGKEYSKVMKMVMVK